MFNIKKESAALVAKMTLEEKITQLLHGAKAVPRLNIPEYNWWNEALHGVARAGTATVFPQSIALSATFDEELMNTVADVISTEARAKFHAQSGEGDRDIYKGLTFWSPNINIFRDPRWGRGHETYGEDPYLTSRMGVAFIKGMQGDDRNSLKTAACAKHFAVHSGPEADRHSFNAVVNDYDLWNTYLFAFDAAVREGETEAVMGGYNRMNGEPCCGSKTLLRDILRDKWNFDGHVVSDCWAIKDFHDFHKVTKTPIESAALAMSNGCDVNCGVVFAYCGAAIREGLLTEANVDTALIRLFTARMRLGLLGAPENSKYVNIPFSVVDSPAHKAINLKTAEKSIVLLKNDNVLPLSTEKYKKIAVIGPNANSRRALQGNYEGTASEYITVLEGIKEIAEDEFDGRVFYSMGSHLYKNSYSGMSKDNDRLSEALLVTRESDAVILCLGLDSSIEGEAGDASNEFSSGDKASLNLPGKQQQLLEAVVKEAGDKPVVLVLISGSALNVSWADEHVPAILQVFYPGAQGGRAVANVIYGKVSPEGKLPVTFYRSDDDLPDFSDYSMKNRTYRYFTGEALYPFGFGLSYSRFDLSVKSVDKHTVRVKVRNTGSFAAGETVQVYSSHENRTENHVLCGIGKVFLQPGKEKEISITLGKNAFSRYNSNGDMTLIPGLHKLYIGFSQPDKRSVLLTAALPVCMEVII